MGGVCIENEWVGGVCIENEWVSINSLFTSLFNKTWNPLVYTTQHCPDLNHKDL